MTDPARFLPLRETRQPADAAALADAIRRAAGQGTPVYPIGGATLVDYGARPTRPGIGLALGRINRLVDHADRDLTITVGAGMTLAELARHLAAKGQRLPLDIPQPEQATVGGAIAAGLCGPRRYAHGTLRDYVLGLSAVDGRGEPFSCGGRVVKNAAGYDLARLLVGSLGTLGVVTQATLMVRPIPEQVALSAVPVASLDQAEQLLTGLAAGDTLPTAVELLVGTAWQNDPPLVTPSNPTLGWLAVGYEGTAIEVDWMLDQFAAQCRQQASVLPVVLRDADAHALWLRLTAFSFASDRAPDDLALDLQLLPSAVVSAVDALRQSVPNASMQSHAGSGVIRAVVPEIKADAVRFLVAQLRRRVAPYDAALVVRSAASGADLPCAEIWGPPPENDLADGTEVMERLKLEFDPAGILNPGRLDWERRPVGAS